MKKLVILFFLFSYQLIFSQINDSILPLEEYLAYVKKYHPIIKQARLISSEGEIKLLKSRGAFDPKLEVDYGRKKFKGTAYYKKLNTTFKIPTWYGIDFKANYENNEGAYLSPEYNTPDNGLFSAGISMSLAKGLLINQRMATLKQAKLYNKQAQAKQKLLVNDILYQAINTYFNWLKNYQAKIIYNNYVINATLRLKNVKKNYEAGDKPAIDTLEASINLKNRLLNFEKAKIGYIKSTLELSNYLWLENNLPLELEAYITPDINTVHTIDIVLNSSVLNSTETLIKNHPKLQSLRLKKERLAIDKKLKTNNILPKIDFQYNFLSPNYNNTDYISLSNFKSGLNISFPLFLRKERADLKLAKLNLENIKYDIAATQISLKNKIESSIQEMESYTVQDSILRDLVNDYKKLVKAEERKFNVGESSLFLVNYREVKLIESQLKQVDTEYKLLNSKSSLLRVVNKL
ncbi:TolC family protein [Bacteroidota bacterium]